MFPLMAAVTLLSAGGQIGMTIYKEFVSRIIRVLELKTDAWRKIIEKSVFDGVFVPKSATLDHPRSFKG